MHKLPAATAYLRVHRTCLVPMVVATRQVREPIRELMATCRARLAGGHSIRLDPVWYCGWSREVTHYVTGIHRADLSHTGWRTLLRSPEHHLRVQPAG